MQLENDSLTSNQNVLLNAIKSTEKRFDGVSSQLSLIIARVAEENDVELTLNETGDAPATDALGENLAKVLQADNLTISTEDTDSLKELCANMTAIEGEMKRYRGKWSDLDAKVTRYDKELQELKQYIKLNNLLFHKFPKPNQIFSRISYVKWIAHTINVMLQSQLDGGTLILLTHCEPERELRM